MKNKLIALGILISILILSSLIVAKLNVDNTRSSLAPTAISLPPPITKGTLSIEEALQTRRSSRQYKGTPLSLKQISQLLWAAQGITTQRGFRTAPSAGALYPLEVYVVTNHVTDLADGIYHYLPKNHRLHLQQTGDKHSQLAHTSRDQSAMLQHAEALLVITGMYKKTTSKYGPRGKRYVHMEAGHVAENISLQAVSLGLGVVTVGGFDDEAVKSILNISQQETPLYIIPLGKI